MRKKKQAPDPHPDPHATREAQKYDKPIVSREYIMRWLDKAGRPLTREQIAEALEINDEESLEALRRRLRAMERDGQLIFNRRREYGLISKMDLIRGRVMGHPDGFGFLITDDASDDLFLSAREMRRLLHGDRAVVSVAGIDRRGRREAKLVEVLERANQHIVGRLYIEGGVGFVVADNKRISQDILVPSENQANAHHGQIVSVALVEQPTQHRQAIGKVVDVLGDHMAPGMEIDIAIRSHNLPQVWPKAVEQHISSLNEEVAERDKQGREDCCHLPLVTIDGEDARDFDDAVFCQPEGKGWRLVVAIADVSHYVQSDTALDNEAHERGNSVYFPERVIPMLPEILSNGLCSLKPEVDRLCMVCDMHISAQGDLKDYRFYKAVMHSRARLTYTQVAAMLVDKNPQLCDRYKKLLPALNDLYTLYKILRKQREQRGAIDFESTETRIIFGEQRKIEQIIPVVRNDAHKLIEECMITANVATARFLLKHKIATLYRIHEGPKQEKLEALREFLAEFGLHLGGGDDPQAVDYANLLTEVAVRPDAHLIQTVMLRSLQQAVYHPDNVGHFGLAYDAYAHFTSPIRRYPDLLVHRAIYHLITKRSKADFPYSHDAMVAFGEHCSQTERRADEATRDAVDWLKCEYMMDKVGGEYEGTISGVTSFGLFIELDNIYVEGLIHVTSLGNDYYHFDPVHHRMVGERTRQIYRLGDRVKILVARVDLDERKIDFDLVGNLGHVKTARSFLKPSRTIRSASKKKKTSNKKKTINKKKSKKKSKKKTDGKTAGKKGGKKKRNKKKSGRIRSGKRK